MMTQNEREYRSLMTRIGGSLLIFLGLISVSQTLYLFLGEFFSEAYGEKTGFLISELAYAVMYLASFMVPVAFFRLFSKKKTVEPMRLTPRLTADTPLLIFASIGLILVCAAINTLIIEPFISPSFDFDEMFVGYDYSESYKVVIHFISISLVPGICEEFLFRGMVLGNLLPYGRTGAVIASAILFGLMHQNPLQMFYATMAGIVLGLLYIYTESIWCSMLVHISNNAFSVLLEWIADRLGDENAWQLYVIQGIVFMLAGLSIILLLVRKKPFIKKPDFSEGVFEKTVVQAEGYQRIAVKPERKIRLFFAPTMIIFLVLSILQMVSYLLIFMVGTT